MPISFAHHRIARVIAVLGLAACAHAGSGGAQGTRPNRLPAPWSGARLASSAVPAVYRTAWRAAENRATCALLVPESLGAQQAATPRAATFSGGWGVAYDLPGTRSAFGVAGAGVDAWAGDTYDKWPHTIDWADGSRAGYGPEGGSGPNELAYLEIPGQRCLYNVWSRLGQAHLESLLAQLRFVATPA
jgi:hypothetical protein